jgi:glutaredoxin
MKVAPLWTMLASLSAFKAQGLLPSQRIFLLRFAVQRIDNNARRMTTNEEGRTISVTGTVYESDDASAPVVTLFTKKGCTLCDKVKDVLETLRTELPHTLKAVDITDHEHDLWFSKYKYDIPVLHVGGQYWIKHRLNEEEARLGLKEAMEGAFLKRNGEPDAGEMEKRQAERLEQK